SPVAGHQLGHPPLRDVVLASNVSLAAPLDNDGGDDKTGFGHPPTSKRASVSTADGVSSKSTGAWAMSSGWSSDEPPGEPRAWLPCPERRAVRPLGAGRSFRARSAARRAGARRRRVHCT